MYSRHETFHFVKLCTIKCRNVLSYLYSIRETCIGAQFGKYKLNWKIFELLLIIAQLVSLYSLIFDFVWTIVGITIVSESFGATGLLVPSDHLEISQAGSSHVSATAP